MDYQQRKQAHLLLWWNVKVLCGLLLIVAMFVRFLADWFAPLFTVPNSIPVALVVAGGSVFLYHYYLIKRQNQLLDHADHLVTKGGLFRYVRHPMYLGDILMFTGFTLLAPSLATLSILALAVYALVRQAIAEDRYLSQLHKTQHGSWIKSTKLLFPTVF
ncbi:MAG: DUF1295 domain-containing protein [Betaproteobacteria bacterium]|nr:MAG: DUF1295 domain-containing protein [Betaproteobacteria bacterium]